jgi:hypothetical protein
MPLNRKFSTEDFITSDNSRTAKKISQHIDRGFTASIRDFDITLAQQWYKKGIEECSNEVYGFTHTGQIITTGFVLMRTGVPSGTYYGGDFGIGDFDEIIDTEHLHDTFMDDTDKTKTYRWKIYKQSKTGSSRKLVVECFNKYPVFNIEQKGVYDVDVTVYDENGNKYINKTVGAITVI